MSVERKASVREYFSFALPLYMFYGLGRWKGKSTGYFLLPAVALLVCMPVDRESECARHFFSVCAPPGFFYGRGVGEEERVPADLTLSDDLRTGWGGREQGAGVSLFPATVLLVCMSADREGYHAEDFSLLRIHR